MRSTKSIRSVRKYNQGMSLLETMICLILVAMMSIGLIEVQIKLGQQAQQILTKRQAMFEAQQQRGLEIQAKMRDKAEMLSFTKEAMLDKQINKDPTNPQQKEVTDENQSLK